MGIPTTQEIFISKQTAAKQPNVTQQLDALLTRLKKASVVEIDEKNLAKVEVKAPQGPLVP